jgi:Putative 8-oxoguanine DNA glycosylase OGG-like protein
MNVAPKRPMKLVAFKSLIANMPVSRQSFDSKRSTWSSCAENNGLASRALASIFGTSDQITVSRSDLRCLGRQADLADFVVATIIWGYPSGMRGNHDSTLMKNIESVMRLLNAARSRHIANWESHYAEVRRAKVAGLGLSTYTKFLNFLSVKVEGYPALILDDRIIKVSRQRVFEELGTLRELTYDKAPRAYLRYLACLHKLARKFQVSAESIEFFLFEFGLNLKV